MATMSGHTLCMPLAKVGGRNGNKHDSNISVLYGCSICVCICIFSFYYSSKCVVKILFAWTTKSSWSKIYVKLRDFVQQGNYVLKPTLARWCVCVCPGATSWPTITTIVAVHVTTRRRIGLSTTPPRSPSCSSPAAGPVAVGKSPPDMCPCLPGQVCLGHTKLHHGR
jgi:hypothetical protein